MKEKEYGNHKLSLTSINEMSHQQVLDACALAQYEAYWDKETWFALLKHSDVTSPKYPECDKFQAVREEANKLGNFIDWLREEKKYTLAKWYKQQDEEDTETKDTLLPEFPDMEKLLAEYFKIDLGKMEKEKLAMLEECRKANTEKHP